MSSKASTTIGFERRFNRALAPTELEAFVAASASISAPKPPNVARIVALNRGPFVGVPGAARAARARPRTRSSSTCARSTDFLAGHRTGALNVAGQRLRLRDQGGLRARPGRAGDRRAGDEDEAPARDSRPPLGRLPRLRGLRPRRRALRRWSRSGSTTSSGLLDGGAELLDVREQDERDEGYIAGSRNIPYRLLAVAAPTCPRTARRHDLRERRARGVAASVLAARGLDARPVVEGGIPDWIADGKPAVSFRRCGSG